MESEDDCIQYRRNPNWSNYDNEVDDETSVPRIYPTLKVSERMESEEHIEENIAPESGENTVCMRAKCASPPPPCGPVVPALSNRYRGARYITSIMADYCFEDKYVATTLRELFLYLPFYIAILIVVYLGDEHMKDHHNETIENALSMTLTYKNETRFNFHTINTVTQIWQFLNLILNKNVLLDFNFYNKFQCGNDAVGEPFIMGNVRLYQFRVSNRSCPAPPDYFRSEKICFGYWDKYYEEKNPFGLKQKPAWVFDEKFYSYYHGRLSNYYGHLYFKDLKSEKDFLDLAASKKIEGECIEKGGPDVKQPVPRGAWIDNYTRAVLMNYQSYAPTGNLFTILTLVFEIHPNKIVETSYLLHTMGLFRTALVVDYLVISARIYIIAMLIFYLYERKKEFCYFGKKYFHTFWSLIEVFIIVAGVLCPLFHVLEFHTTRHDIRDLVLSVCSDSFEQPKLMNRFRDYYNAHTVAKGFLVFFATLKFLKFLAVFHCYSKMLYLLKRSFCAIGIFLLMFNIVLAAYAMSGHVLFCATMKNFETMAVSFFTIYAMIVGAVDLSPFFKCSCTPTAYIFVLSFFIIIIFLLLKIMTTGIIQGYADAKCTYLCYCKRPCRLSCYCPLRFFCSGWRKPQKRCEICDNPSYQRRRCQDLCCNYGLTACDHITQLTDQATNVDL